MFGSKNFKNLGVDTFPRPVGHFGAPGGHFGFQGYPPILIERMLPASKYEVEFRQVYTGANLGVDTFPSP